jgi:hypothetical protein
MLPTLPLFILGGDFSKDGGNSDATVAFKPPIRKARRATAFTDINVIHTPD